MKSASSYVPPAYIPLGDSEAEIIPCNDDRPVPPNASLISEILRNCLFWLHWSFLSVVFVWQECSISGFWDFGSCTTHFILWSLVNTACCFMTDGLLLGSPGCFVACYACGYRRTLREKYNLQAAPCRDFVTHFCCHLCANYQEYREICERSGDPAHRDLKLAEVTPPTIQKMESDTTQ